jgi:HPt (histidine-containing phosphotransfer) domain-containing protein
MTSTPSEIATEKLRELVQADGSLDQAIRDAIIADLGDAQPSRLKVLNGALAGEKTDAAIRAEGEQPEGSAG